MKPLAFAVVATTLFLSNAAFANTRICVSVQQKSWYKPVPPSAPAPAAPSDAPPPAPVVGPAPAPPPEVRVIEPQAPPYGGPTPQAQGQAPGTWGGPPPPPAPPPVRKVRPPANPHEIDPTLHLRRMLNTRSHTSRASRPSTSAASNA